MTYIRRTSYIQNRGPQYDWSTVLCGSCMEARPGWELHGGPDTTYDGAFDRPFHAHQPDQWCAGPLTFWGLNPDTCCSDCGCSLSEDDAATWGRANPGKIMRLAEAGNLWRETTTLGDHRIDGDRYWTKVTADYLLSHPHLLDPELVA
jgi:hypothetical protein